MQKTFQEIYQVNENSFLFQIITKKNSLFIGSLSVQQPVVWLPRVEADQSTISVSTFGGSKQLAMWLSYCQTATDAHCSVWY